MIVSRISSWLPYIFLFCVLFSLPFFSGAVQYQPPDTLSPTTTSIPQFISSLYDFGLILGGILAVFMILAGGIYFLFFNSILKKQVGLDMVWSALWGLLLLFSSYLILKNINPELVKLKNPGENILFPLSSQKEKENPVTENNIEILPNKN